MTGHDIKAYFDANYPESDAFEWDHVGLQVGDLNRAIKKIMLTLDVTPAVVEEAIHKDVNFIVSHHPLIFHPLQSMDLNAPEAKLIETLIRRDITVYSAHTNYDVGMPGMNGVMADLLGLKDVEVLNPDAPGHGIGRTGTVDEMPLSDFMRHVKKAFDVPQVTLVTSHALDTPVSRIALSGGSGSDDLSYALESGVDLFMTGDIKHHTALDMETAGIIGVDMSHFAEHVFKADLAHAFKAKGLDIVLSSENSPFRVF